MTAPAVDAPEAIEISTFYVRETSAPALVEAMAATGAKLAKKLPGLAVHVTTGDPTDAFWCAAHRAWVAEGKAVCYHLSGLTADEAAAEGRCWIGPARQVQLDITATGLPTWGDWDVYAVLTASSTGAVTATCLADRHTAVPAEHVELSGQCAHCNRRRARTTTVLLRNTVTGEVRPVGKSCLADYTGSTIRFEALAVLTSLAERFAVAFGGALAREPQEAPTVDVVALAMRYSAARGKFISSSSCNWSKGEEPTAFEVRKALVWSEGNFGKAPEITADMLTAADRAAAAAAIASVLADRDMSPFAMNLRSAAAVEWTQVDGKGNTVGLLAALPGSAERAAAFAARQAARDAERAAEQAGRVNAWIGAEKARREFTGTIRSATEHDGDYGTYQVIVIDTPEGTVKIMGQVTWPTDDEVSALAGRAVTLTGTITRHEEYRDEKTTRINRVKVTALA